MKTFLTLPSVMSRRSSSKQPLAGGGGCMYYNVFGEKVSRRRYKEMCEAAKNRRELIAAGLTSRRDLFRMGLLTAGGMLVAKSGLSARAQNIFQSPGAGGNPINTNNPPSSGKTTSPGTNQNCVPS